MRQQKKLMVFETLGPCHDLKYLVDAAKTQVVSRFADESMDLVRLEVERSLHLPIDYKIRRKLISLVHVSHERMVPQPDISCRQIHTKSHRID